MTTTLDRAHTAETNRLSDLIMVIDTEAEQPMGALVLPAQYATTEAIAFMVRHTSGFLCVAMTEQDCERMMLPPVYGFQHSRCPNQRVSVDLRDNGTGISADARARTIRGLASAQSSVDDFTRPGHVVPVSIDSQTDPNGFSIGKAAVACALDRGARPVAAYAWIVGIDLTDRLPNEAELQALADEYGIATVHFSSLKASWPSPVPPVNDGGRM